MKRQLSRKCPDPQITGAPLVTIVSTPSTAVAAQQCNGNSSGRAQSVERQAVGGWFPVSPQLATARWADLAKRHASLATCMTLWSVRALATKDNREGARQDRQIDPQAVVLDIV